jgi:hypothetical protein
MENHPQPVKDEMATLEARRIDLLHPRLCRERRHLGSVWPRGNKNRLGSLADIAAPFDFVPGG